jgi:hypothetical protein
MKPSLPGGWWSCPPAFEVRSWKNGAPRDDRKQLCRRLAFRHARRAAPCIRNRPYLAKTLPQVAEKMGFAGLKNQVDLRRMICSANHASHPGWLRNSSRSSILFSWLN